ncbi:MAG: phosphatase PAP2 family protein [Thermoanaerobaculia bacterium]
MAFGVARVGNRRIVRRPYFFEIFVVANFVLIVLMTNHYNPVVLRTIPDTFQTLIPSMAMYAVAGAAIRAVVAAVRRELPVYLRLLRSPGWIVDTIRVVIVSALMAHTYFWIKLLVPLLHRRNFDQLLWDLDQAMFFGLSPNILFLDLFSPPLSMRFIDWSYAKIFFASMMVAFIYFLSSPSRRVRIGFVTGTAILWLIGAWLYMLVPSLGPAFRFPELWMPLADSMPVTQTMQAVLMRNYQNVLQWPSGVARDIQVMFGIAAFPSLHVGFQAFAFLWMRRLWIYGEVMFGVFLLIIVIGSVVTGWHYLIDGVAGTLLAVVAYLAGSRPWRIREWRRLRAALRKR